MERFKIFLAAIIIREAFINWEKGLGSYTERGLCFVFAKLFLDSLKYAFIFLTKT
jgi:hypothetical protein